MELTSVAAQLKLLRIVVSSWLEYTLGTCNTVLKQEITSSSDRMFFIEVVPMMRSFLSAFGGFFLISTSKA